MVAIESGGDYQELGSASSAVERSAVVDLHAIRQNVQQFIAVASTAKLMAVVKADGYGHGALQVARAALDAGAHWLGVAHIAEAVELRAAGIQSPLLAWLHTPHTDFSAAVTLGIDVGVSGWELPLLIDAVHQHDQPARVHLKVDTGLGRNGSTLEMWSQLLATARCYQDQGLIQVVGIFSHLAVADEPERAETDDQLAAFHEALAIAEEAGINPDLRHLANTPATLTRPDCHFDMVRVGIGIYGLSPFTRETPEMLGLRPAMTLRTNVSSVRRVPAGQGVSYGLAYRTTQETVLALIPVGYADGIPRTAQAGSISIQGRTYPVVGRVAMDQIVIDLGPCRGSENAFLGAEAIVFGLGVGGGPTASDWATAANTINYEIVTRIGPRVARIYTN